jgi:hypothetical protein
MRKALVMALAATVALTVVAPSGAATKMTRLGTDPDGDGYPSLDITYLDVGRNGRNLEIRIGLSNILPEIRSIPEAPGVQWAFDVKNRTFVAEGAPGRNPRFFLFELFDDGSYEQIGAPEGTYDAADGYLMLLVPLADIAAKKGTVISGTGPKGTEDVDAHIHAVPGNDLYPDKMATTKDFVVR